LSILTNPTTARREQQNPLSNRALRDEIANPSSVLGQENFYFPPFAPFRWVQCSRGIYSRLSPQNQFVSLTFPFVESTQKPRTFFVLSRRSEIQFLLSLTMGLRGFPLMFLSQERKGRFYPSSSNFRLQRENEAGKPPPANQE